MEERLKDSDLTVGRESDGALETGRGLARRYVVDSVRLFAGVAFCAGQ